MLVYQLIFYLQGIYLFDAFRQFTDTGYAVEGILLVDAEGEVLCYHKSEHRTFADFLFLNTRLEKGSVDKDKYGFLEKENGVYYFRLNVKIGLTKK